jgi:putative ABC transport system permease protein
VTLYQIALRNLSRRKSKMVFMLLGLVLGASTVVSIYSIVKALQLDIRRQLAELGANIVITADTGELTFQYGGITIPELVFDAEQLTEADLEAVGSIPGAGAILAAAPKLIGTVSAGHQAVVIAGIDLPAEFAVKPWLRFYDGLEEEMPGGETDLEMEMNYRRLNLNRAENVPNLAEGQVVLGYNAATLLEAEEGGTVELGGKIYAVLAVLEEGGMAEDNQVLMNLAEAQSILGRPGELTVIEIASDFNQVPEMILLGQLQEALPHASITGVRQAVMGRDELLSSLSRFGMFASVVVLFTGALVVMLTMSAAVRERTREIGIFRAIGFRGRHVFAIIVTEGLFVSAVGGLIGYHAGLLAARLAGPLLADAAFGAPWQPGVLLLAVAATAAAGGLASLYPALRAARLDPAEALRFF